MKNKLVVFFIICALVVSSSYLVFLHISDGNLKTNFADTNTIFSEESFKIADPETDLVKEGVNADNIEFGCAGADCIPSIDKPVLESREEADSWLAADDLVFTVKKNNTFRAYPQRVLNWHEIVNDEIDGEPVAVTFCPLCGSALAFKRTINDEVAEFGVSGRLLNNNLIMYDRTFGGLWQQETGELIVGDLVSQNLELEAFSIGTTDWQTWSSAHPDTQVLSRETGFDRDYDRYPYGTYEEDGRLLFGLENQDDRLGIKAPGYGFEVGENDLFYTEEAVAEAGKKRLNADDIEGFIVTEEDGTVYIELSDGTLVSALRTFWFAWASFHPESQIITLK